MTYAINYPEAYPGYPVRQSATRRRSIRFGDKFLYALGLLLLGYALGGRGFAYWGYRPIFVGEMTLTFGVIAFARSRQFLKVMGIRLLLPLQMFVVLGLIRTVPYWHKYTFDCIRDAAIWGFGAFAFILCGMFLQKPDRLNMAIRYYRKFCILFLCLAPFFWAAYHFGGDHLPAFPGGDVAIIQPKGGDLCVHLAGVFGFIVAMGADIPMWLGPVLIPLNIALNIQGRAGLMSFITASFMGVILRPFHPRAMRIFGTIALLIFLLWATDLHISDQGDGRDISAEFLYKALYSVVHETDDPALKGSKEWRLKWWADIRRYTLYGEYFWTGKGFGINLALDDGYDAAGEGLRSPHNGHMTILAREGVPGIVIWSLVHLTWMLAMTASYIRARKRRDWKWSGLFLALLIYYAAFLTNMSFDVFIEGPMGGIWLWCIYGTGIASIQIFKRNPEVLYQDTAYQPPQQQGYAPMMPQMPMTIQQMPQQQMAPY